MSKKRVNISGDPSERKLDVASIAEIRGRIIDRFVLIESDLNYLLTNHFNPSNDLEGFKKIMLNSSILTYGSKVKLLFSLGVIENKLKEQLYQLGNIRNAFAHLSVKHSVSVNYFPASNTSEIDQSATIEVLHANGNLAKKDAYQWAKDFTAIEKSALKKLKIIREQ
ncbi:MAG: hypothetical protein RIF34_10660 [Candidatus Kapaibacterium sp.]